MKVRMTLSELIEEEKSLREDVQEMAIEWGLDNLAEALETKDGGSEEWVRRAAMDLCGQTIDKDAALQITACLVSLGCLIDRADRIQHVLESSMISGSEEAEG